MPHNVSVLLEDIRDAAQFVLDDTAGETLESYQQNRRLRLAVERSFMTMGEAMRQLRDLDRPTFDRITDRTEIIAFRNVLVHEYGLIEDARVWRTVQRSLPILKNEVEALLREAEE
jgi:uncharacterized protein with HEPN domain